MFWVTGASTKDERGLRARKDLHVCRPGEQDIPGKWVGIVKRSKHEWLDERV